MFEFLCDLENYRPLHPLIESIEPLSPSKERPDARRYRVVDRIALGPFRLRTVYTAALEPVSEHEIHGYAWQSPRVRVHTIYRLEPIDAGTRLVESASIEAPRIILGFVVRQARNAHAKTLEKMKAHLDAGVC